MFQVNKTTVVIVLDETSSMGGIREKTVSSLNEYLDTLKTIEGSVSVTLVKFNSAGTNLVFANKPAASVEHLALSQYVPQAMTNLYDAVGDAIGSTNSEGGKVLFVVITDGEENCSKRFSQQAIQKLVRDKTEAGWTFVYLGADLSKEVATQQGMNMGFQARNSVAYGKANTDATLRNLAGATAEYAVSSSFDAGRI